MKQKKNPTQEKFQKGQAERQMQEEDFDELDDQQQDPELERKHREAIERGEAIFQVMRDNNRDRHMVLRWTDQQIKDSEKSGYCKERSGYREVSLCRDEEELKRRLSEMPAAQRWVVLEDTDARRVYYELEDNLSDSWTGEGTINRIALFDSEDEARAYVEERQAALGTD